MKNRRDGIGYNERLFSNGLRSKLHYARFHWFQSMIKKLKCPSDSVLELGCFDGKLLKFLPRNPAMYLGFDANWEGGLDIAKLEWAGKENYQFLQAASPEEMHLNDEYTFNIAVAMETLEHVPPDMVDGYLKKIAKHLKGYFFVTVPNEKGLVFLCKWIYKKILSKDATHYSFTELINASLGRMQHVYRKEHKGFDYLSVIDQINVHFEIIAVSSLPMRFLPRPFCFGIGIIAKTKNRI